MARHGAERALHSLPIMPTAQANGARSPGSPGSLSPLDSSRIPRLSPSPQALRRSQLTQGALRTHQQEHFPAITENGSDSPIKRSSSSLSLTPLRGRTRPRASPGSGGPAAGCSEECSDAESVRSFGSNYSTASACDHASFALNGTTWSGRSRRYVVHCSSHAADGEEYLTPTQRAARQVRKFQALLRQARAELEDKDREIFRLTKELVELRLYKASLNSPDDKTDSSETATVREVRPEASPQSSASPGSPGSQLASPRTPERKPDSSLVDSGHFDDGSVHSKESAAARPEPPPPPPPPPPLDESAGGLSLAEDSFRDEERRRLVDLYESRIEEMHRRHVDEVQLLKESHNDKVEALLNQLAEVSTRYCEARPSLDAAEARARELEAELEASRRGLEAELEATRRELAQQRALLEEQEQRNKQMYLKMYSKGQEAARIEQADQVLEQAHRQPASASVAGLLQQLAVKDAELENVKPFQDSSYTPEPLALALASRSQSLLSVEEAVSLWVLGTRKVMYRRMLESKNNQGANDPEITLQFLKSAVYYFLTDKENLHGHLNAIESILGFSDLEKLNIDRIYRSARK